MLMLLFSSYSRGKYFFEGRISIYIYFYYYKYAFLCFVIINMIGSMNDANILLLVLLFVIK